MTMHKRNCSSKVKPEEMAVARAWIATLTGGKPPEDTVRHTSDVPFSFNLGTRSSREWITVANASCETRAWEAGERRHVLRWSDPITALGCTMELTEYRDFPALEWVIRLRHDGADQTAALADFKALDIFWKRNDESATPELRRALGSDGRHDDFQLMCEELKESMWKKTQTVRMDAETNMAFRASRSDALSASVADSRPSATWLPFFNLRTGSDGILCALGWSGRWFAEFAHDGEGRTDISAGMEHLELRLRPGEEIRSPRVLLLCWQGTPIHAQNMLRQFVLKNHRPRVDGRPAEMPVCNGSWGGTPTQGHLETIKTIADRALPYDYYWVDAGWYGTSSEPCPDVFHGEWGITGDWRVNRNYHPHGLKPISDAAHKAGMKFLLWIEPERAKYGTPVTLEHPEWFLRRTADDPKSNDDLLLNLANPEAWQWAVDTVSALISENGIDCYREDFNLDPGPFWNNADEAGRKGFVEIRFVEGLYAFWEELQRRHPGLLIDNCASGGRRLDLETISRSVTLWRTDYNCFPFLNPDASQAHGVGLNLWLPSNATSPFAEPGDTYQVRSAFSAGIVLNLEEFGLGNCQAGDFPWDWFAKMIGEAKRVSRLFLGDFYPLTPGPVTPEVWIAYQLLEPNEQAGAIVAFRRSESPMTAATFALYDLQETGTYEFEDADGGRTWQSSGLELMTEGLRISMDTPRSSRLFFYKLL